MALPSSPPLLPELDLPPSPPPLPEEAAELPLRPSERPINRKRQFSDYGSLSSDPVFSEGPSDADEEEAGADRRRRKKFWRGPWFSMRRASTQSLVRSMARRERARNADSGVFMGSDLSDDSVAGPAFQPREFTRMEIEDDSLPTTPPSSQLPQLPPTPEQMAAQTINHCLECGQESVDLSDLGLANLDNSTLRPLHQLIKHPHADLSQPPSEDEFSPFTPSIRLFLSGNKLARLPPELFKLTNIAVLSLRNNQLDEIPASIGQLPHLREFNIAQNNITWLPWEMLDLMHCRGAHRQVTVRPNPLVDPIPDLGGPSPLPRPSFTPGEFKEHLGRWGETNGAFFQQMKRWYSEPDVPWSLRHELELRLKLGRLRFNRYLTEISRAGVEVQQCNEQLLYVASSAVRFFGVAGSPCRTATHALGPPVELPEGFDAVVDPLANVPPLTSSGSESGMPSLYELSLRSLQRNFAPYDFYGVQDDLPSTISGAVQKAFAAAECGNGACSVCGRHFIVARAEWMEYWFNGFPSQDCLTSETLLPFLRRVCSWQCAQPSEVGAFRF